MAKQEKEEAEEIRMRCVFDFLNCLTPAPQTRHDSTRIKQCTSIFGNELSIFNLPTVEYFLHSLFRYYAKASVYFFFQHLFFCMERI